MESFPFQAQDVPPPSTTGTPTTLRRRAHTSWSTAAAAADGRNGNAAMVSPEQSQSRRRLPTANTNAAVGANDNDDDDDDDDDFHLSSCSSSSLGGSSSVSGSSDFHRDALLLQGGHHHAQRLQQPQLHRRHTYAGGTIAAAAAAATAAAETPRHQRQSIAIEIPVAMKEVVIRHSRSRLVREDVMNDADGNGDNDDIDDGASTLSSLEVDLGHCRGIGGGSEQQDDPRRRYMYCTDRRREASNNTTSSSTNRVYSSTNALCGAEADGDGDVDIDVNADGTATNLDGAYHHKHDDAHVDDDEPSYMSYSLSTSSPCKSSMIDRPCSGGAGSRVGGGAARNHNNRRPPGHFKSRSRDSSLLGGLGLLEHIGAAAPMTAADGTKSAATVYSAEGGRRSTSPSHQSKDSSCRVVGQDEQSFRHAAPTTAQLSTPPIHDVDEKLLNQHPPKRTRSHRRHFSESCLLNTSIGTDTDTTADSSHCLSHHHIIHNNNIGSSFGPPPPSSLLQFSGGSTKRMHRRCASAGCGVHVAIS